MANEMMRMAGRGEDGTAKAMKTDNEGNLSVISRAEEHERLRLQGKRKLGTHELIEQERLIARNLFLDSERLIGNGDSLAGWTKFGTGEMTQSTEHKETGTGSIKLVSSDNVMVGASMRKTFDFSQDTHFRLWAYSPDPSKISAFRITFHSPDSSNTYIENSNNTIALGLKKRNGAACELSISKADFSSFGTADWSKITNVVVELRAVAGQTAEVYFDNVYAQKTNVSRGKVILRFDDGWKSVYQNAFPTMVDYCLPAVAVVNPSTIGGTTFPRMTLAEIKELDTYGWDISSHAWKGMSFLNRTGHQTFNDLKGTQNWLVKNGFDRGSRFHVFSNHEVNEDAITAANKLFHINNSGIFGHETLPFGDPYNLRYLGGDNKTFAQLKTYVDNCATHKTLAIITFHDIVSGGAPYTTDPTLLSDFIKHLAARNDIDVITFSDIIDGSWIATR